MFGLISHFVVFADDGKSDIEADAEIVGSTGRLGSIFITF